MVITPDDYADQHHIVTYNATNLVLELFDPNLTRNTYSPDDEDNLILKVTSDNNESLIASTPFKPSASPALLNNWLEIVSRHHLFNDSNLNAVVLNTTLAISEPQLGIPQCSNPTSIPTIAADLKRRTIPVFYHALNRSYEINVHWELWLPGATQPHILHQWRTPRPRRLLGDHANLIAIVSPEIWLTDSEDIQQLQSALARASSLSKQIVATYDPIIALSDTLGLTNTPTLETFLSWPSERQRALAYLTELFTTDPTNPRIPIALTKLTIPQTTTP